MFSLEAPSVVFTVLAFLGSVAGGFAGAYAKKKGENLATKEDIGDVVEQMRVVTQTTKEIEARISSEVWDRQKQWEMKREVLFEASKALAHAEDQIMKVHAVLSVGTKHPGDANWMDSWREALIEWRQTVAAFESAFSLVTVVCSVGTTAAFIGFRSGLASISAGFAKRDEKVYEARAEELTRKGLEIRMAIRKELGVDPKPQSTESAEPPIR